MPTDPQLPYINEGADVDAAPFQAVLDGSVDAINDLPEYALDNYALRTEHLPGFVGNPGSTISDLFKNHAPNTAHVYENTYPGYGVLGASPPPVGAGGGAATRRIISDGVSPLQTNFVNLRLDQGPITAIKLCANIELDAITDATPSGNKNLRANFAFIWRDSFGTWRVLRRSERFRGWYAAHGWGLGAARYRTMRVDIPLRSVLLPADTGTNAIDRIAVAVSVHDDVGTLTAPLQVHLRSGNFVCIPMYAKVN
jgi:hypothetical protein